MKRFFTTAGPIKTDKHYYIPPLSRLNFEEILSLIEQEKYFVLHAPRQTGKTSLLRALMNYLNQEGDYVCLHINVEKAQAARENVKEGIRAILDTLAEDAVD
ncbi:MAG: ATP-binding protein, partial [bacterium]|nr:ATP-binding protein [bacterium]